MKNTLRVRHLFLALLLLFFSDKLFTAEIPDVTIAGVVNTRDGIGSQATVLLETIKNEGLDCRIFPIYIAGDYCLGDLSKEAVESMQKPSTPLGKVLIFEDWLASIITFAHTNGFMDALNSPESNPASKEQVRIAYSMFESTQIPGEWVDCINQLFDCVVVPDQYYIDVYVNSGVKKPIFFVPLPLLLEEYINQPIKKGLKGKTFTFACLGSYLERKNQLTLVRAFAKKFKNNPHVQLYLNGRFTIGQQYSDVLYEIRRLGLSNVTATLYNLSSEDYFNNLTHSIDCLVNISRGEGFSIQPREAMALGIPTILSDNTAQSTMCKLDYVLSVPSNIPKPFIRTWDGSWEADGVNFDCTVDDVAEALESMYYNYSWYMSKGEEAREWTRQYLPENLKEFYLQMIKPSKIVLGKTNEISKEGLITSSKELYDKYVALFPDLIKDQISLPGKL